jgi:hypothetical protein
MKSEISNISVICHQLADMASVTGGWSDFKEPQTATLYRAGSVHMEDIDSVAVTFEAKRIPYDEEPTRFPYVSYILRLVAIKDLVYEELPSMARATIEVAEVKVSTNVAHITTDTIVDDNSDDEDEFDDDNYRYERSVQYILDRKGRICEYTEAQGYSMNDQILTQVMYAQYEGKSQDFEESVRENRIIDQRFTITDEGVFVDETPRILSEVHPTKDIRNDLSFIDFMAEHSNDMMLSGQSIQEHHSRMLAMISFITLQSDAKKLIETSFA